MANNLLILPTEQSGLTSKPQLRMLRALELRFSLGAQFQAYKLFAAEPRQLPHIGAAVAETSFRDGQAISRSPGIISPRGLLLDTCTAFIPPAFPIKPPRFLAAHCVLEDSRKSPHPSIPAHQFQGRTTVPRLIKRPPPPRAF